VETELSQRAKSIKMSGEKCSFGETSVFNCHCNDCYNHIGEYLGKKKGQKYFYNGKFAPTYIQDKEVIIHHFSTDERDKTSSCECMIKLFGGEGGQVEWIPREEIINNLLEIKDKEYSERYPVEKENQEYVDSLNIKSKCCNSQILATSEDDWLCSCCGKEVIKDE